MRLFHLLTSVFLQLFILLPNICDCQTEFWEDDNATYVRDDISTICVQGNQWTFAMNGEYDLRSDRVINDRSTWTKTSIYLDSVHLTYYDTAVEITDNTTITIECWAFRANRETSDADDIYAYCDDFNETGETGDPRDCESWSKEIFVLDCADVADIFDLDFSYLDIFWTTFAIVSWMWSTIIVLSVWFPCIRTPKCCRDEYFEAASETTYFQILRAKTIDPNAVQRGDSRPIGKLILRDDLRTKMVYHDEKWKDFVFYVRNNHSIFSALFAHPYHEFKKKKRIMILIGSTGASFLFTLVITLLFAFWVTTTYTVRIFVKYFFTTMLAIGMTIIKLVLVEVAVCRNAEYWPAICRRCVHCMGSSFLIVMAVIGVLEGLLGLFIIIWVIANYGSIEYFQLFIWSFVCSLYQSWFLIDFLRLGVLFTLGWRNAHPKGSEPQHTSSNKSKGDISTTQVWNDSHADVTSLERVSEDQEHHAKTTTDDAGADADADDTGAVVVADALQHEKKKTRIFSITFYRGLSSVMYDEQERAEREKGCCLKCCHRCCVCCKCMSYICCCPCWCLYCCCRGEADATKHGHDRYGTMTVDYGWDGQNQYGVTYHEYLLWKKGEPIPMRPLLKSYHVSTVTEQVRGMGKKVKAMGENVADHVELAVHGKEAVIAKKRAQSKERRETEEEIRKTSSTLDNNGGTVSNAPETLEVRDALPYGLKRTDVPEPVSGSTINTSGGTGTSATGHVPPQPVRYDTFVDVSGGVPPS